MQDTEQKLREALQAIANIDDATSHSADASAAWDRIGQIARQGVIDLPTKAEPAAQEVADIERVYQTIIHWDDGGKRSRRELARRIVDLYTTPQPAPASAGNHIPDAGKMIGAELPNERDKVDAARYRWLREQESDDFEFAVVKNPHFDVYQSGKELDAAIDAAMRALKD